MYDPDKASTLLLKFEGCEVAITVDNVQNMGGLVSCLALGVCECACCCACTCCKTVLNATLAQVSRIGHLLIVVSLFAFAIIIGQSSPNEINNYNGYSKIELDKGSK
jgi:hypothetical protein